MCESLRRWFPSEQFLVNHETMHLSLPCSTLNILPVWEAVLYPVPGSHHSFNSYAVSCMSSAQSL